MSIGRRFIKQQNREGKPLNRILLADRKLVEVSDNHPDELLS